MLIKKFPEDFIVEEIPDFEIVEQGEYAVYRLKKTNLNTEHAIELVCEILRTSRSSINYAGTKDKNAVSTQYISIHKNKGKSGIERPNLHMEFVGFCEEPLSLGSLKGNKFQITVRELSDDEKKIFEKNMNSGSKIPNYFDEQRFSQNNLEIGISIIKKDFKKASELIQESFGHNENFVRTHLEKDQKDYVGAIRMMPKKILSMYIHSVQSYLYNHALSELLKEYASLKNIAYKEIPYSNGQMIFYQRPEDYKQVPVDGLQLVGFDTTILSRYIAEKLKELQIEQRDFIIRALPDMSVEGSTRKCFVDIEYFSFEYIDEKTLKLSFNLPKGSYATIFIKALFSK